MKLNLEIKNRLISFLIILNLSFVYSQSTEIKPDFGVRLTDKEIKLPDQYNYLTDIQLEILLNDKSRSFYAENNEEKYSNDFIADDSGKVTWNKKEGEGNIYQTVIPPLKPNRFYRLKVSYYSSESIVAMFLMMHDEKNSDWYSTKKEWMKLLNRISDKNFEVINGSKRNFPITYDPTLVELISFKNRIKDIDLAFLKTNEADYTNGINDAKELQKKKEELKNKKESIIQELDKAAKLEFEVLNFVENQNKYTKNDLVKFCETISSKIDLVQDDTILFSSMLVDSPDYVNIYNFYEKYLLGKFKDDSIKNGELKNVINEAIETEKKLYTNDELIPNYLKSFKDIVITKTEPISTYPTSFETSFKLSLVPDLGYVVYLNNSENTPQGGNLFFGINITLSPSNKNVPLQISKFNLMQRLSIQTGLTLGSIEEKNVRDDLFGNYSLLLGGSYKVLTQGTRINVGGLFYNKIDAINGSKSIAIQPYVGVSIDLEIAKWIQSIFPKLKV